MGSKGITLFAGCTRNMSKRMAAVSLDFVAVIVAVLALIVAIVAPLVTYFALQNDIRIQQLKATALRVSDYAMGGHILEDGKHAYVQTFIVQIIHEGQLPVDSVEVIFDYKGDTEKYFNDVEITTDPPLAYEKTIKGNVLTVSFTSPLAPGEDVSLSIEKIFVPKEGEQIFDFPKLQAWLRSEATPAVPILSHGS